MTTLDTIFDEVAPQERVRVVSRSELERWATCPARAALHRDDPNAIMDCGGECHRIIGEMLYQRQAFALRPAECRELMLSESEKSRPDVQPDVVAVLRRATFRLVEIVCYDSTHEMRHPDDLMIYDGGKDDRSGQLAADVTVDGIKLRVTGEVDLMIATPSPAEADLYDWKSGWTWWTPSDVKASFQFQVYAWLVMQNYPEIQRVNVRVMMLREAVVTQPVYIDREQMNAMHARIVASARLMLQWEGKPVVEVPAWPDPDKCGACTSACRCPAAAVDVGDVAKDPAAFLRDYVAAEAKATRMKAILSKHVRTTGKDILDGSTAFGVGKPKSERAPSCGLYEAESLSRPAEAGEKSGPAV